MENNKKEIILGKILNNLHKATLKIPILEGYEQIKTKTNALIVAVSKDNSVMQYIEDGKLDEQETFENRLNKVINETEKSIKENGLREKPLIFIKNLSSDILTFKLYQQDNIVGNTIIRQINAYFIEPESKYFYEISLSAPPIERNKINDYITENIIERIKEILLNITYNDTNPFPQDEIKM